MDVELGGKRVAIIEDAPLIALAAEEMVRSFGCAPIGPAGTMASALELVEKQEIDAAIVDLNVRGSKTFSIMAVLSRRRIPFLIVSGYADWKMPDEWLDRPRLQKPFDEKQLRNQLLNLLGKTLRPGPVQ